MSLEDVPLDRDPGGAYDLGRALGKGSFGTAFLVTRKQDRRHFVLKRIRLAKQSDWQRNSSMQEREMVRVVAGGGANWVLCHGHGMATDLMCCGRPADELAGPPVHCATRRELVRCSLQRRSASCPPPSLLPMLAGRTVKAT